jgi:hypothetical protein
VTKISQGTFEQQRRPRFGNACIGGEHEDYYDPDVHIYNDVVVLGPGGEIEIYG